MDEEMKEEYTPLESEEEIAQEVPEKKTSRAEKPVPKMQSTHALPASRPEILSKILKSYVIASKQGAEAVKYTDVGAVAALHPTEVSKNNTFLSEAGFIIAERYGYYKPSPEVTNYAKQAPWDEENAKGYIRALIERTWFGQTVQQQFQLQNTLNRSQLIKAFGIKATPDASDANRLGLLVDCLLYFGYLVNDEDGNFIARPKEDQTIEISHGADVYVVNGKHPTEVQPLLPQLAEETAPSGIACRVNINLNLTPGTTDEELEALVQKVKTAISLLIKRAD
jgi:hypothetical protein